MTIPLGPTPGVGAVIVEHDHVLLIRRGSGALVGQWAVPGGHQRFGETMREAVAREVREETGLEVEVGEVVWAGDAIGPGDPPAWHFTLVDFEARRTGGELMAGDDATEVRWVDLSEAIALPLPDSMHYLLGVLRV